MQFSNFGRKPTNESDGYGEILKGVRVVAAFLVGVAAIAALIVVGTFINGLVLRHVWNVIFPQVFGDAVPLLTVWQAAGVSLVVTYFNVRTSHLATKKDVGIKTTLSKDIVDLLIIVVISPLVTVLLASFIASRIAAGG